AEPWSKTQAFIVTDLAAPNPLGPSGVSTAVQTVFTWSAVPGADHYDFWVLEQDTNTWLEMTDLPGPSIPSDSSGAQSGVTYAWKVRAVDTANHPGPWSNSLTYIMKPLPAADLLAPSNNSGLQPNFTWNPVPGASKYDIWAQDERTGQILRDQTVMV